MKVNFLYEFKKYSGKENMDIDLSVLNETISKKTDDFFVRFYGWEPKCISLGRNQKPFVPPFKIDVVTRPTGGRALLHDKEITYMVAGKIPENCGVLQTYKMISDILIDGFKKLSINLEYAGEKSGNNKYCMNISSGSDICYNGKKLIGSAQFRKEGYFLQHGSILRDIDYSFFEKVFLEKIDKEKITTINEINPKLSDKEIIDALKESFIEFGLLN